MELFGADGIPIRYAKNIRYDNTFSGLSAAQVQAALDEIISTFAERAQDAVAAALTNTTEVAWTYNDAANQITADLRNNSVAYARLVDETALSVLGRASNSSGSPAPIVAANDGDVLRRSGTSIGFGSIVLSAGNFANPTSPGVNLTGANGTALTAMRSDAVLVLDQGISPDWTALHKYSDMAAPSLPASGHSQVWSQAQVDTSTISRLWVGNNVSSLAIGYENHMVVYNTSGSTIPINSVVYVTGSHAHTPTVDLANANSAATLPAVGITQYAIANNSFGVIQAFGELINVDTHLFTAGQNIYLSDSTAGAYTATAPTAAGSYVQALGVIAYSSAPQGIVQVRIGTALAAVRTVAAGGTGTSTAPTDGQLLIGNSSTSAYSLATLSASTGISITNGHGTISVANTGVTSVALADGSSSPIFSISGSPVTTTGTLTHTLVTQAANKIFAGPTTGAAAQPTFRSLVDADIPTTLSLTTASSLATVGTITSGTWHGSVIAEIYGGTNQSTYTLGDTLYASAANTLAKLAGNTTSTKKFLRQTGTGTISAAPAWDTLVDSDIPTTLSLTTASSLATVGTITSGTWSATAIAATKGGTGQTSYTLGDTLYSDATNSLAKLAGNTTTTRKFKRQVGNGTISAAPVWDTLVDGDIPTTLSLTTASSLATVGTITSGTWSATAIAATKGGTGQTTYTLGDTLYSDAANSIAKLAGSTSATKKFLTQTGTGTASAAPAWAGIVAGDISALTLNPWTGTHFFNGAATTTAISNAGVSIGTSTTSTNAALIFVCSAAAADAHIWEWRAAPTALSLALRDDAFAGKNVFTYTRSANVLTDIAMGNATDNNTFTFNGTGAATFGGVLRPASGAVGAPSLSFSSETSTGFYRIGASNVGLSLGGTLRINFTASQFLLATSGATVSAPDIAGNGATNTGFFWASTTTVQGVGGGVAAFELSPTYLSALTQWRLTGVISPTQIAANTNDYAPTGLSTASVLRLSTDASRNLTGLTGGATGRRVTIFNVGTNPLVLTHNDAASTAANRFLLKGSANQTLNANDSVTLWYDGTSSEWRQEQ